MGWMIYEPNYREMGTRRCYNCQKDGHIARFCNCGGDHMSRFPSKQTSLYIQEDDSQDSLESTTSDKECPKKIEEK